MVLRALFAFAIAAAFSAGAHAEEAGARAYPEGDVLFHADERWLGGDAAISVPLSAERTLWLFGDSFVDETPPYARVGAAFVHNTIAVETGGDPRSAQMHFVWRHERSGSVLPYFPDRRAFWYWPRAGIRVNRGDVIIFLHKIKPARGGLRFSSAGYAIARISNVDADPVAWRVEVKDQPVLPFDALPGGAVVIDDRFAIVFATRQRGVHAAALVRYPLRSFAYGDLSQSMWWLGEKGWARRVGRSGPSLIIDDAGAESSVHWDARSHAFIHVASYGFGASTIGMRTAQALTGPWSGVRTVYRPPESDGPRPFVYAAKAHPELTGAPGLLVTYVANSFDPNALLTPEGERDLYWPHFATIPIENSQH
jgi:hypothetical protein